MKENAQHNRLPGRIYLVGFMGSGKSTAGKRLARVLGYRFADLDKMIEEHYKTSIPLLFEQYDEEAFRLLEQKMLHSTQELTGTVIATGGGTPAFSDNMDFLNRHGLTVYLEMPPKALAERLLKAKKKRPLLKTVTPDELVSFIGKKLTVRESYYRQAHLTLRGVSVSITEMASAIRDYSFR